MDKGKRFGASTVMTISLLVGFVGFGVGINYPEIKDRLSSQLSEKKLPADLNYEALEEVYDELRRKFAGGELSADTLLEGAKRGLVAATGDPNTVYLDEKAAEEFRKDLSGTFSGIGAEVAVKNEQLVVVAPLSGSPAKQAGLRAGDHIAQINDEPTGDMSADTAVSKIRGEAGSVVKLTIVRGNQEPQEISITRAVINVPDVKSELKASGIGYIEISRFDSTTVTNVTTAVNQLKQQGATKFIIDVRNNPGGLLDAAVGVSDEVLDIGKVIVEEKNDGKVLDTFRSNSGGSLLGAPIVVLINEGSASASEIVAGALQDHKVATILGVKSFGKGSVQEVVELGGSTALKVTVALWHTPNGKNISKEGITPELIVELSKEDFNNNRDPQLDRALELLSR